MTAQNHDPRPDTAAQRSALHSPECLDGSFCGGPHCPPPWPQPSSYRKPRYVGVLVHRVSDWLHLLAHRLINDPDWRMRNG
jgi:hypothetical protein